MGTQDTVNIKVGCSGVKVEHYKSGIVLSIKDAELLDLLKYPEIGDYFKKYENIAKDFR